MTAIRRILMAALPVLLVGACTAAPPAGEPPRAGTPPPAATAGRQPGEVWTAGYNTDGQLGRSPAKDMDVALGPAVGPPGQDRLTGVTAVAAGGRHSLAVMADGRVVAWGANHRGQLGDGTRIDRSAPVPVRAPDGARGNLSQVTAIAADTDLSMALRRDGTVVTWGSSEKGERGTGRRKAPLTPTTVRRPDGRGPLTGVVAIAVDRRTGMALLRDGTVAAWGANAHGVIGDGTTTDRPLPQPVRGLNGAPRLTEVTQITIGGEHAVARLGNGTAVAWGRNDTGQLGDGTRRDHLTPAIVVGSYRLPVLRNVLAVSAGDEHNLALRGDGSVVAWGGNVSGQLGNDSVEASERPAQVVGVHGAHLRGVAQIHAGDSYSVAVLDDGTALTWGSGGRGQLGSGNRMARSRPGTIVLAGGRPAGQVLAVGAGQRHLQLLMRW